MTQEDKELLLKDLSSRLPYQPYVKKVDTEDDFCECDAPLGYSLRDLADNKIIIKPYLRSLSSMTEEEKIDYLAFFNYDGVEYPDEYIDWLNKNHFDYRGLIERDLAIEAPEGMYC
jgi:hypothetical protein